VCGTVGKQPARQLLENYEIQSLTGIDNNESELAFLEERYGPRYDAHFLLTDLRDSVAITRETRNIEVLFDAAAYKHVFLCERSPFEAIQTNVIGVHNIARGGEERRRTAGLHKLRQGGQPDQRDGNVEADGRAAHYRGGARSEPSGRNVLVHALWQYARLARFGDSDLQRPDSQRRPGDLDRSADDAIHHVAA
jgi:hypothetical protein